MAAVVDLFCGIGGMTHGFRKEGFDVVAGIDIDSSCKYAYESNNAAKFVHADIQRLASAEVNALYPAKGTRVLIGCAPCQPFSPYSNRKSPDRQWQLLRSFASLAIEVNPDVLSMENVPRLMRHRVFDEFVKSLEGAGYAVTHSLVHGVQYGIPQRRIRLVLFASRYGPISILPPTHPPSRARSVRDAIGGLEPLRAGGVSQRDLLHRCRNLTPLNLERIRATPAGGGWKDWDESLHLACHKRKSGQTFRSVYGRMRWDEPSPVITTQCLGIGNGRFGHPDQDRAISLREAAILQTFPRSYRFLEPKARISEVAIARQIGNAVPVRLGQIVGRTIAKHLEHHNA